MSATVTLTFSTPAEMVEFFKGIGQAQAVAPSPAPSKPAPAPKAAAPAAKPTPTTVAPATPVQAPPPAADAVVNGVRYVELQQAVQRLAAKKRELAVALLAEFGVPHFKELPAEKWADALRSCNAKLDSLPGEVL